MKVGLKQNRNKNIIDAWNALQNDEHNKEVSAKSLWEDMNVQLEISNLIKEVKNIAEEYCAKVVACKTIEKLLCLLNKEYVQSKEVLIKQYSNEQAEDEGRA